MHQHNSKIAPLIIAHRGASAYAPENTMAAFKKAYELGAKSVEFDVVLSKDRIPVIFHDATTTRTTNLADHNIAKMNLAEIKELDAGSWFAPEFSGEKIPTLAEVLQFLKKHRMQACIELKSTRGAEQQTVIQVVKELQNYLPRKAQELSPLISSFSLKSLHYMREALPYIPLAFTAKRWHKPYVQILKELNCHSIHLNGAKLTASQVAYIRGMGYQVYSYTIDDPAKAEHLCRWKVSGIFTNHPDRLLKFFPAAA